MYIFFDGRAMFLTNEAISRTLAEFGLFFISKSSFVSQEHIVFLIFWLKTKLIIVSIIYNN